MDDSERLRMSKKRDHKIMITEEAIYTSRGQLVMEEGTVLTAELISRLSFYSKAYC